MAMYYFASKLSAIACGTRCKQSVLQKSRGQRDRDKLNYCRNDRISFNHEVSSSIKTKSSENSCNGTSTDNTRNKKRGIVSTEHDFNLECSGAVLGTGGIMYINGSITSGPLDSLADLLMPRNADDFDKEFVFSFLLSSRLFIRPHELLGRLLSSVPENESLERLVGLLGIWTKIFPYDYRDERIMSNVKHIVTRCSSTGLEDIVSVMLSALLNRLTDLEQHEENLRACHSGSSSNNSNTSQNDSNNTLASNKIDFFEKATATQFAQILCRIERRLAKHIGPEEFLQCSNYILQHDKQTKKQELPSTSTSSTSNAPPGAQDSKKTCNLETYLDWSSRLRLFVCNEILQSIGIRDRTRIVERWSGVAQYCLLVGNYNSATTILECLESSPIARLKVTWSKLTSTCQQLLCMLRHAEGCGDLWSRQAIVLNEIDKAKHVSGGVAATTSFVDEGATTVGAATTTTTTNKASIKQSCKPKTTNDWVVIPVFADIVKLALKAREDCLRKLPNGHINIKAFDRLAAIVGAFTKHMCEVKVKSPISDAGEYETFCRYMQNLTKLNETELMLASFDCEEPTQIEKVAYNLV